MNRSLEKFDRISIISCAYFGIVKVSHAISFRNTSYFIILLQCEQYFLQ